jgi:predicted  nucleic acid-binding Zn-ribbon protein
LDRRVQELEERYAQLSVNFNEVGDMATKWHRNYDLERSHHLRTYEKQGRIEMKYIQAMKDVHRLEKEVKDAKRSTAPTGLGSDVGPILALTAELEATKGKAREWKERAQMEEARYLSMTEQVKLLQSRLLDAQDRIQYLEKQVPSHPFVHRQVIVPGPPATSRTYHSVPYPTH